MALDLRRLFKKEKQEHRILRQIERGDHLQPEYHRATPECPHPEWWSMFDSMTAEVEVLEFLRTIWRRNSLRSLCRPQRLLDRQDPSVRVRI